MKSYIRKIFNHDTTHEVSVTTEIVSTFFDNAKSFQLQGLKSNKIGTITINAATDPRFGGDFKNLLDDEGGVSVDDLFVIYKSNNSKFTIEIIKKNDPRYLVWFPLFNSIDRHNIVVDDGEDFNPDEIDESSRKHSGVNIILYGVPGAGKSYAIENEYMEENTKMERVVFHPDYTYSDFVGQILPKSKNGDVSYEFMPGPFTKIMRDAYRTPETDFILVIEEINRGNAPAIFGDIFQLLDRKDNKSNKEGESSYGIMNADVAKIIYNNEEHEVRIPSNLSIICTMNTSDQNVFTLDTAFQRRWNMRLIENSFKKDTPEEKAFAEKPILDSEVTWEQFCDAINKQILEKNQNLTSSEDKRLGTHFVSIEDLTYDENELNDSIAASLRRQAKLKNRRFPEKVIKYLWDDAFKFYRDEIFKGEFDSLEKIIKEFAEKQKNDRFNIFKDSIKAAIEEISKKSQQ